MSAPEANPRLQYTIRSRTGVQTFWGPPAIASVEGIVSNESARTFEYSKDGSLIAVVNADNIVIYRSETAVVLATIPHPHVAAVAFSPQNTFLITWERLQKEVNDNIDNLIVWRIETQEPIVKFTQKNFSPELWPYIKWTDDEVYFARTTVSGEAHFFAAKTARPREIVRRLQLPDIALLEFAPGPAPYKFATFNPEKKGQPASVRIYNCPPPMAPGEIRSTASKSFFRATSAELLWNSLGTALLASTSTEVDKSGKSYYGETGIYYLTADASFECNIILQKEGPIHDVTWSPTGKEFIITYGFMPSQSTLYDAKCNPKLDFGALPRNTIRWAPNGKLVCIGGFGNLQGQMDFWDVKKTRKIGTAQAHCAAVCEWAPDSRHLVAAVVSPRIRVDNGYKIFKYDGTLVHESPVNELYLVAWRPALPGVFANRPMSPPRAANAPSQQVEQAAPKPAAPAKYQHPNARSAPVTVKREDEGVRKYKPPQQQGQAKEANLPVGYTPEPTKKSKKKKKNKKDNADGARANNGFEVEESVPGEAENSGSKNMKDVTTATKSLSMEPQPGPPSPASAQEEKQKKIKALNKKLRQIELLKEKQSGGASLTPAEVEKVKSEASLRKDMQSLKK